MMQRVKLPAAHWKKKFTPRREAINIGKQTKKIVWQNIILAFVVKAVVLVLGAGGLATLCGKPFLLM